MPDYTLCTNTKCPKRTDCVRYLAKFGEYRQSYMKPEASECDAYWSTEHKPPFELMSAEDAEIHRKKFEERGTE